MHGGEASTDARGLLIEGVVLYPELAGDGVLERPVEDGAIWIESGTIRAIGPREALRAAAGTGVARLDGQGALAVPGLVDSHIHLGAWAMAQAQPDLSACRSVAEVLARLQPYARKLGPGQWLVARGLSPHRMEGAPLEDLAWLDAAFPDRPVVVWTRDLHSVLLNRAGRLAVGIGPGFDGWPPGSVTPRDPATGDWVGVFREKAVGLIEESLPRPSLTQWADAIDAAQLRLWRLGLVGAQTPEGPEILAALSLLHQRGRLGLRVRFMPPAGMLETLRDVGLRQGFGDEWLRLGPVKAFADGSLGSLTAALEAPYSGIDAPGYRGELLLDRRAVATLAVDAARTGFALAIHAIGDRACREVLEGLEAGRAGGGSVEGLPHRIEHAQLLAQADAERMGRLGVIASVQPIHLLADRRPAERYWRGRTAGAYAMRWLAQSGVVLAFGSDAPVEDPDPLRGIWAAVTRRPWPSDDPEEEAQGPWHPEHALSVVEALRAYTQGPARAVGEGSRHGGLRPGMPGDVALLAPDPVALERALPPGGWTSDDERAVAARHHLSRVRVVATVVAGRIAHTA